MTGFMISKEQFEKDSEVKIYTKKEISVAKLMIPKEGNSLADYPEYAKLFDYELSIPPENWNPNINGAFIPKNIAAKANYSAYFKCPNGHDSYKVTVAKITEGQGCSICADNIRRAKRMIPKKGKSLAEVYPQIAKEFDKELSTPPESWDSNINGAFIPDNISANSHYSAFFKCLNCYESYPMMIANKTKSQGCPICADKIRHAKAMIPKKGNSLAEVYPQIAKEFDEELSIPPEGWNPNINGAFIPDNISKGANYLAYFKCPNGHDSYEVRVAKRTKGQGCPICTKLLDKAKRMIPQKGNSLAEVYPQIAKEFDKELSTPPESWNPNINGAFIPDNINKSANYQVFFKCLKGHDSYPMAIYAKVKGNGCPICGNLLIAAKRMKPQKGNSLAEVYPQIAKEFDEKLSTPPKGWDSNINGAFIPDNINKSAKYQAFFKCLKGHDSYSMPIIRRTYNGSGCPICKESHGNKLLVHIFQKHHLFAKREFKFPEFKGCMAYDGAIWNESHPLLVALNSKEELIIPKNLTYLPDILIEYDGWQHIQPVDFAGKGMEWAKSEFQKNINRDNYKNKKSVEKSILLLRIPPIYDPIKDANKIEQMILEFKRIKKVPKEILDFYAQYKFSEYVECVQILEKKKLAQVT